MKLESFLRESIESAKAWAIISSFSEDEAENIKKAIDGVKHFKFVEESIENPEDSHDGRGRIEMTFSDGLLNANIIISTSKDESGKMELGFLMCSAKVLPKYLVDTKDNRPDLTYFSHFSRGDGKLDEKIATFKKATSEFVDWYFDMSGVYGKVKLFRTHYDILDGYHDSNKPRFVAIAGDFLCTDEISDAKPMKVEPRVL